MFPFLQNSGGFFIAVFTKTAPFGSLDKHSGVNVSDAVDDDNGEIKEGVDISSIHGSSTATIATTIKRPISDNEQDETAGHGSKRLHIDATEDVKVDDGVGGGGSDDAGDAALVGGVDKLVTADVSSSNTVVSAAESTNRLITAWKGREDPFLFIPSDDKTIQSIS